MASDISRTIPLADVADLARLVQGVDAILNQRNVDEDTFRFVSAAAVDRLGYPLERWLTEPGFWLDTLVHPDERDRLTTLLDACVETAGSSVLEYRAIRADGAVVWLRDHIVVDHTDEGRVVRGVILDITDIREAEATADRSYRALELLKEIAEQANLAETGEAVLTAVLGRVKHHLGMHVAHAWVRPRRSELLLPLARWYAAAGVDATPLQQASEPFGFSEGFIGRVASTGEPLWLEDVSRSDLFLRRDAAAAIGIHTAVAVPVLASETTAAVLEFFSTRRIPPDRDVLDLLASVGTSLGRAFEWEWNASEIRERERRLREAQRTARLGGWSWDAGTDRITLSDELREVVGQRCEDLSGASLLAFTDADDQRAFETALDAVTRGQDFEVEPTLRVPGREPIALHIRGRVHADPATGQRRVEGTAQDVTQRRAAERTARDLEIERRARQRAEAVQAKLVRTAAALARSNRQLDEFAYIASHDLKAPLRGIANLVRYLEEDIEADLTDETRRLMELLQTRVRWMQELIDGILRFSRAGRETVAPEDIETRPLIEQILAMLPEGPAVDVAIEPGAERLSTPVAPLRQVLLNLISNACRYAPDGHGEVHITAAPEGDEQVRFSVRDNGPGIAPEFQDRIWAIFQTLEARDAGGGSGIGLAVVRKLVEQNGGRAWVDSRPGEGATFHFTWPREFAVEEET